MTPDIEKYRPFVDRYDLSNDKKDELIRSIWRVVEGFAYRSFGLDPVRQVIDRLDAKDALAASPVLDFEKVSDPDTSLTDTFRLKARKRARRKT